jgi:hypothetical protein
MLVSAATGLVIRPKAGLMIALLLAVAGGLAAEVSLIMAFGVRL